MNRPASAPRTIRTAGTAMTGRGVTRTGYGPSPGAGPGQWRPAQADPPQWRGDRSAPRPPLVRDRADVAARGPGHRRLLQPGVAALPRVLAAGPVAGRRRGLPRGQRLHPDRSSHLRGDARDAA